MFKKRETIHISTLEKEAERIFGPVFKMALEENKQLKEENKLLHARLDELRKAIDKIPNLEGANL